LFTLIETREPSRRRTPKSAPTLASRKKISSASGSIFSACVRIASASSVPRTSSRIGESG